VFTDEMSANWIPDREDSSADRRWRPELARAAVDAARGARRQSPLRDARSGGSSGGDRSPTRSGGYSGARADARDPQLLGAEITRLFAQRGWKQAHIQARIFGAWDQLVGVDLAAKCAPVSLRDGELIVAATSTAWATQLRMLAGSMLTGLRRELDASGGCADLVRVIRVHGPVRPSWKHGIRSVPGRGPRDTYG
jgi:predicted nucleic acid-binding Zn ribbon protein